MMDGVGGWWAALGLLLIAEGLVPLVSPGAWRRMVAQLAQLRDGQIRFCALASVAAGLAILSLLQP